jgi:four helix bundle protein
MENQKDKEEKEILERTKDFSVRIIRLTHYLKKKNVEYFLRDQVGRSGCSIGANIHEAKASSSNKEFCRFYEIALRSAHETGYWFELLEEIYKVNNEKAFLQLKLELIQIIRILASIIIKLKRKISKEEEEKKNKVGN